MQVRGVRQAVLLRQQITQRRHARQRIDAEGVGGAHGGDDAGHRFAGIEDAPQRLLQREQRDAVLRGDGHGDDVIAADAEPAGHVEPAVVRGFRGHDLTGERTPSLIARPSVQRSSASFMAYRLVPVPPK